MSSNGQDFSSTDVHFEYQRPVAVRALEPSRGPIEGGTFVNVTGSGFSARAALLGYTWCRFNSTSVAAAWRSSTELHCVAPRHQTGVVSVEVTQNEQQHTSDGLRFEFEVVAAYSVYPTSGPLHGVRFAIEAGLPTYQHLDGPGLETDWITTVGVQYAFE